MNHSPNLKDNHLLATLPATELFHIAPYLEGVYLQLGQVLYESGCKLHNAYFPTSSVVSLLYDMKDGYSSEIAGVGNEGVLGVALFMGGETMPNYAVVQSDGYAFNSNGKLRHLLLQYAQSLITQIAQTAVCNRHHSLDQQLCRWLLLTFDRLNDNELTFTQESIANILGVRRESVTEAARNLQQAGLIHYSRGHITILNKNGLEERVCECYQVVKTEYERLLPYKKCPLKSHKPHVIQLPS
jgi:CRP-like cAMP-binding protein